MKLRQCVFVCKDLESSAEELCATLGIEIAYRDPGVGKWGLANVVCPTGHDFLEIVSPTQPGTSAGRYIELPKGHAHYMLIRLVQIPDGRGHGVSAFDVKVVDRERAMHVARKRHDPTSTHVPVSPSQIVLCGCRINLV